MWVQSALLPTVARVLPRGAPVTNLISHLGRSFFALLVSQNARILLANSNQWYFNNLVKRPCHKTPYRCPHRFNLSFQSSRSCALPNIKVLKDKGLEFANSIRAFIYQVGVELREGQSGKQSESA